MVFAGAWRTFTGNEIGILLAHWMWCCWRRDHLDDDPACVVMLASAVSSKMLQAMAQVTSSLHMFIHHAFKLICLCSSLCVSMCACVQSMVFFNSAKVAV